MLVIVLLSCVKGESVGVFERYPYVSKKGGVFNDILELLQRDLNEEYNFQYFDNESLALDCVSKGRCKFSLCGLGDEFSFSLSYPVFSVMSS